MRCKTRDPKMLPGLFHFLLCSYCIGAGQVEVQAELSSAELRDDFHPDKNSV